jgi:hypothetical protein
LVALFISKKLEIVIQKVQLKRKLFYVGTGNKFYRRQCKTTRINKLAAVV